MIIVDTGPLVALCDARDALHRRAVRDLRGFSGVRLLLCEPVLVETCFHLAHSAQRRRLHALIDELDLHPVSGAGTQAFRGAVFDWLLKYADHEPDWTDGCIAVLCGHDERIKVWTYDREFRTIWRRPDGSTIPLAVKP